MKDYIEYTVRYYNNGTKEWYLNDKLHREDGPAVERAIGDKEWWLNDKRHREDGPAVEYANGSKYWYLNGNLHREDGPAIEYADGGKEWWLNGIRFFEEDFNKKIKKRNNKNSYDNKVVEIDGKKYKLTLLEE